MKNFAQRLRSAFSLVYDKASNEEIRSSILKGANVKGTNMIVLMLAIFIASIGLNMNSTAVIIGAMLISPLMGGIMAIGYGMATNDLKLTQKAAIGLIFQVMICIATSTLYFSITPISAARAELLARTTPTIWDVLIALLGGLAGIIGVTRKEKTNVIPGVAIATALMPPLCTAGYGLATSQFKFVVGAFYLFFINSFFICISTYIIIRIMRIPKVSYMDEASEKKVKRWIYIVGTAVIIPSIILAYQIVSESVYDNNVQRYINNELIFEETQVVRTSIDKNKKEMKVALLGKRISSDTIELLNQKLEQYNLQNLTLRVTQTETSEGLNYEDIQALIEKELGENQNQIALGDRDQEIALLKEELIKYKTQLIEYQSTYYDVEMLGKELIALYPAITEGSLGNNKRFSSEAESVESDLVAIMQSNRQLTSTEKENITNWIKIKTQEENVKLYIEVTSSNTVVNNPMGLEPEESESN